jgi:hypothetical protein
MPRSPRCPMPATRSQRDAELVAERQPLTEFEFDAAPGISRLETEHVLLDCAAVTRVDIPEIESAATLEKSSRVWRGSLLCGCRLNPSTSLV